MVSVLTLVLLHSIDAPVTQVTVFTDQARVVRSAQVALSGEKRIEFPPLSDAIDANSIRVEATGGEVRSVDIERVKPEVLKTAEAKALISQMEALDVDIGRMQGDVALFTQQEQTLTQIHPVTPTGDPLKAAPKLNAAGWTASAQFVNEQLTKVQARHHDTDIALRKAMEKRETLAEQARKIGQPSNASGWQVTASMAGSGTAQVTMTYVVGRAYWTPQWDLQLLPDANKVSLSLAGLVSQQSQEDWSNATLVLSTAIPANAVKAPCLTTWKIGSADRFIPTPSKRTEYVIPPPQIRPLTMAAAEDVYVRQRLLELCNATPAMKGEAAMKSDSAQDRKQRAKYRNDNRPAAPTPPPMEAPAPMAAQDVSRRESTASFADEDIDGERVQPQSMTMQAAPGRTAAAMGFSFGSAGGKVQQTTGMSLAPPAAWAPPTYGADSPVMLAGGYDLSFTSLQKESIPSGDSARRVALWSQQWPVTVERKVYPAISPDAFLVAELKNPSTQVLPGGPAQLFVGADPAGAARLKLVAAGESFTLPLGIDRAIKPIRKVDVVDAIQGVISKDDFSTYTVTIEVVNPYRQAISLRVFDQFPISKQKEVETKFVTASPQAIQDAANGGLEWKLNLKPQEKQVITFSYTLKRPKDWKMQQREVTP